MLRSYAKISRDKVLSVLRQGKCSCPHHRNLSIWGRFVQHLSVASSHVV